MASIARGDEPAFARLVERYWAPLVHYASSLLDDAEGAEDAAQETFIRVWEGREEWKPVGKVSSYLYRITRNLALDRRRKRRVRERGLKAGPHPAGSQGRPPLKLLEEKDLRDRIGKAVDALPQRRREAFVLAHMHDLSYREVGEVMGVSPQTVANQVSAALRELRSALRDLH